MNISIYRYVCVYMLLTNSSTNVDKLIPTSFSNILVAFFEWNNPYWNQNCFPYLSLTSCKGFVHSPHTGNCNHESGFATICSILSWYGLMDFSLPCVVKLASLEPNGFHVLNRKTFTSLPADVHSCHTRGTEMVGSIWTFVLRVSH